MKVALLAVAACAFGAALALPVPEQNKVGSVSESTQALLEKIERLVESHNDLVRKIEAAGAGSLSDSIKEAQRSFNEELRSALEGLQVVQSGPSSGPSDGEQVDTKDRLRQRIAEIRQAIASATSELASIIWEQVRDHGGKISESLAIAKKKVLKRLSDLKDELLKKLRELMIPDDDVPVNYVIDEVFEQIIDGLKNQIKDALKVMSNWQNLLSESGRAKVAAAKKRLTELAQKIADTVREWRRAKESESTTESSNYAADPFYNEKLILMMQKLLEESKDQLELKKLEISESSIGTERELLTHFEEAGAELSASIESIREMIKEVTGVDVLSSNIVSNLRRLLALKMEQLQQLIRGNDNGELIRTLEREIVNIRRRLIEAVQDVFQKP